MGWKVYINKNKGVLMCNEIQSELKECNPMVSKENQSFLMTEMYQSSQVNKLNESDNGNSSRKPMEFKRPLRW